MEMFKDMFKKLNLTKNTTQKLISLIFAIVFWLFVMDTENPEMIKTIGRVPVDLVGVEQMEEQGLKVMNDEGFFVDVKIKGRRKEVMNITISDFKATVDIYQANKGTLTYPITVKSLREGITLESLSQTTVKLSFDQIVTASKPIKIEVVGEMPSPYYLDPVKLETQYVEVNGPESIVNQVAHIQGTMDVTGMTASFSSELSLVAVDVNQKRLEGVTLNQDKQKVNFAIVKEKSVPIEAVFENAVAQGYYLMDSVLSHEEIVVIGDEKVVDALEKVTTRPINLSDRTASKEELVQFALPEGIRLKPGESCKIALTIEPIDRKVISFNPTNVQWLNAKAEYDFVFEDKTFDVVLEGATRFIEALKEGDVSVELDVLGLEPGKHQIPVKVTVPEGVQWIKPNLDVVLLDVFIALKSGD